MVDQDTESGDGLKGRFPFRLGTTSYIVPDDIEPNVQYLSSMVDDVEVVLFESDEYSNIPDAGLVSRLASLGRERDLTYTIHLPLDTYMGHADESVRRASVDKCLRIIERTRPLSPFGYVVHFHGDEDGGGLPSDLPGWLSQHRRSVEELLAAVHPSELCVETLSYPYRTIEEIVFEYDLSICLDVGHVLLCGYPLEDYLERYLPLTRIVHLHGIAGGKDHTDISHLPPDVLPLLLGRLRADDAPRVLTLEIFGEQELEKSLDVMRRYAL